MTFEVGKTYMTRGGALARVICVDRKCSFPIVALVQGPDNMGGIYETIYSYSSNGRYCDSIQRGIDLMEIEHEPSI